MSKFTLHNEHGDFMHCSFKTLNSAKKECDKAPYKCKVFETYFYLSPWSKKLTEHAKEVHKNYQ